MKIMTTFGNFLINSARSPANNPNININKLTAPPIEIKIVINMFFVSYLFSKGVLALYTVIAR